MKYDVIKKFLIAVLMVLSNQACANQVNNQRDFLAQSILNTPFTAVVSHTQVIKLTSNPDDGDVYVLNAEVLEPISGKAQKKISYRIFVEFGEDIILNKEPVIISLCEDNGDYYWPGVGAEFPATAELLKVAHQVAKTKSTLNPTDGESHCD